MDVYPYKFVPLYRQKVWGGRNLERLFGRELPAGMAVGESWELVDLPRGQSLVANGPDAGKTLRRLLEEKGGEILGSSRPADGGRFPLLLKLLDANDILSLQVHPDARAAKELGPPATSKSECWYVLESRAGYILKGVKPGVTPERFRQAVREESTGGDGLRELVERVEVLRGDFHYLPAGTVHALGPGVMVAEIQTPSDTTYRLCDWGRGRPLQTDQALRCVHFGPPEPPPGAGGEVLVRSAFFTVRCLHLPPGDAQLTCQGCAAWMVLQGRARISSLPGLAVTPLAAGDTVFMPASLGGARAAVQEAMTFLEVTLP